MAHAGLWLLAGVILGSVTGAATATFIAPHQTSAPPQDASEFAGRVAASMETAFTRAVERVREEAAARADASPEGAAPAAARVSSDLVPEPPRRRLPPYDAAAEASDSGSAPLVRDGAIEFAPKDSGRLERMVARSREELVSRRRQWMFVGEKVVAEAFGLPDEVTQNEDGRENWCYEIPYVTSDGEQDSYTLQFVFSRGRVVVIDGAEDIRE